MRTGHTTLREMRVRYVESRDSGGAPLHLPAQIRRAADVAPALQALLEPEVVEVFVILCLSTKGQVIAYHEVSRGTLDTALVHPRDVFKAALLANAASVIVAHSVPGHRMRVMYPESLCAGVGANPLAPVGHRSRKGT